LGDSEEDSAEQQTPRRGLRYGNETYAILGACFAVYQDKGCGFLEAVYQECLEIEFRARGISFRAQPVLGLAYRGQPLTQTYAADFICFDRVLVEIKAVRALDPKHRAQTMHYLRATGIEVGLLVNFGHYPQCEHERIVANAGRFSAREDLIGDGQEDAC